MPEPSYLFVALLASSVGFVMLVYGKKQHRPLQLAAGILLLVLPFLVRDPLWLGLASAGICTGVWGGVKAGL
ncbi:MAG: hypothetical protein OES69_04295 [Myxococcales bacterium]|jgi:hypothetical protein|nr:hypothetical protein [Myxococcales bacterium]MDH3843133.1 hypothetical protein [Myxococcales bacterium]